MLLLTAAWGQPPAFTNLRGSRLLPPAKAAKMMGYWEREEEPVMAEEERAPSLPVAEEREVEPTFSGEAMPEAAAEERYAANEGAQTVLTNKTLRIWVGRWYCGDRSLPDISTWNTSQVTDMSELFKPQINRETKKPYANQEKFNGDISSWDTSNVTTMHGMFQGAKSFNRPIGKWNVEKVTDMAAMFLFASKFNQPIGDWKVHNVTDMSLMFNWASAFNQLTRTVNGTGHTGPSEFCATSI